MEELTPKTTPIDVIIAELFDKYSDNPYMLNRLQTYITNLPTILDSENKSDYLESMN